MKNGVRKNEKRIATFLQSAWFSFAVTALALTPNTRAAIAAPRSAAAPAAKIVLPPAAFAGLNPLQRQILQRLAERGVPSGAALPPAVCFAPGTSPAYQNAVENRLYGTDGELAAFRLSNTWTSTATNGSVAAQGTPITLTWSFVPDGTSIPGSIGEATSASDLKSFLNGLYGNQATWQALFQLVFDRWSELSGVTYVFEPNDDGAAFPQSGVTNGASGSLGLRGDLRISGHLIDGASNVLAYNFFPNGGDMVIDTGDGANFGNTTNNSRKFRNTLAHEHGHGLGFNHVCPVNQSKLMEPFLATTFDGPQLDDIMAVQRGYGDAREKTTARNNDTPGNAAYLGALSLTTTTFDTLSIDGTSDVDVYRFTSPSAGNLISITLRPTGATYLEGSQNSDGSCTAGSNFNSQTINDLAVELRDADGTTVLGSASSNGVGVNETISNVVLPSGSGEFYVRVTGGTVDNVQMYALDITLQTAPQSGPDFVVTSNSDGSTNGICDSVGTGDGCTLREAITAANANANDSIITFSGVTGTIQLESALPTLSTGISIQGPGANLLTVRGEGASDQYRIFDVNVVVSLSGLTLSNGSVLDNGGAIRNSGTLTVTACAVSGNSANLGGGGIYNSGALTVVGSTLSGNNAVVQGGGLWSSTNLSGTACTVRNCTLSGNSALTGGGIYNGAGLTSIENSTITNNTAQSGQGSGVASAGDSGTRSEVKNSIVAGDVASDVDFTGGGLNSFQSNGYNLIGSGTSVGEFVESGDQSGVSAAQLKLGSLANNGGPTQTIALLFGSPALNAGDPTYSTPLTTDQRGTGFARVLGGRLDIGAFEALSLVIGNVTVTEGNSGTANATFTVTLSGAGLQTVTVQYATGTPGSVPAIAGVDYVAAGGTLTFAPGETTKTITVLVNGDTLDEVDERFVVNLSNATNAAIFDNEAFCTITDDDGAPTISINDVTVTEGNSETTAATFTVSLSAPSGKSVTVRYATTTPGSIPATAGTDYVAVALTTLTFAPGETSKQITVLVNGDTLDEDTERFSVNLSSAGNATIADKEGFCTINDDDAPPSLRINDVSQAEGNSGTSSFTFTVSLSAASGKTVTVKYQTALPSTLIATPGTDYIAVPLTALSFTPGQTSKTVTVLVNGDTTVEGAERFVVKLSAQTNATIADSEGFGTITNEDVTGLLAPFEDGEPSQ